MIWGLCFLPPQECKAGSSAVLLNGMPSGLQNVSFPAMKRSLLHSLDNIGVQIK